MELAEKSYSRRNAVVTGAFTIDGKEFFIEMEKMNILLIILK